MNVFQAYWEIKMPSLDDMASRHFTFRALCEVGSTWRLLQPDNTPKEPETRTALAQLATDILDPLWDQLGQLEITYGHAGAKLYCKIQARATHELAQHVGFERNRRASPICHQPGEAVDFQIAGQGSLDIARHIVATLAFDSVARVWICWKRRGEQGGLGRAGYVVKLAVPDFDRDRRQPRREARLPDREQRFLPLFPPPPSRAFGIGRAGPAFKPLKSRQTASEY